MGDWKGVKDDGSSSPGFERLADSTFVAFGDCDASPSKAFMVVNRDRPDIKPLFDSAFRKRPEWELYDSKNDPHELRNLAADPASAGIFATLKSELELEMKATKDPRAFGQGNIFDRYEYLGNVPGSEQPKGKAATKRAANRSSTKDKP
jgi:hypothetical protein